MVQGEKQTELCLRILQTCRAELCDLFPYLDAAFDCLRWRLGAKPGFSVDGQAMYFPVRETLECYSREPAALRRGYLHMLLHCLYLHIFMEPEESLSSEENLPESGEEPETWNRKCDFFVENLINEACEKRVCSSLMKATDKKNTDKKNADRKNADMESSKAWNRSDHFVRSIRYFLFVFSLPFEGQKQKYLFHC